MNATEQMHQEDLARLKALRYMDDDFMTVCLADNFEGVELILRIVLGREDIRIKSVRTQEPLKNLQGRSAVLDIHAVDSTDKEFDVEIQRKDAGAGAKRARHNSSLLDAHILKSGDDTHDFSCTNPDDMNYEVLAKKARYFKLDEKGVTTMCKIMEDMRNEAELNKAKKMAIRMIKAGKMSLEDIADYTELSLDKIKELASQAMQLA